MPDGTALDTSSWSRLLAANERLAAARTMAEVIHILRDTARAIVGADGICVVLREGDLCHYAAEDAMAPLWAGQRFPAETCVSGWAMMNRTSAVIPDVLRDARIPQDAYAATFVRSMIMVPVGLPEPTAAIGAYWSDVRGHYPETIQMLEMLARSGSIAIENVRLLEKIAARERELEELNATLEQRVEARTNELAHAQDALRQSQKLEAMGQLTGGVAHDFNNLLTPIIGSLDLLQRRHAGTEREQRLIDGALQSAERARILVQRLLAFARRQPLNPTVVDIAALMLELSPLIGTTIGPKIALDLDIAEDLPFALADPNQIEMAILNLAVNARDAMPGGGRLILAAQSDDVGEKHPVGLARGRYIRLSVSDTGTGMDEATLARAIEPFFSTKGVGKGTGLGLSMVHGLASQLGGGLAIASRAGLGTVVELWLPLSDQTLIAEPLAPASPPTPRSGTALVVDDEDFVRATTVDMLGELGFGVIEARSGPEALDLIEEHGEIGLLVTDHLMPEMTGAQLATTVRAIRPDIGILIVSGYTDPNGLAAGIPHLEKPFRQADLAAGIAAATRQIAA
jgi:signal transduction histidine kinase/CheY-like chemotaxis protein